MNKTGSHVGMIMSFVIFVTFIVFLYTIVRPAISLGQKKETIADYLFLEIIKNVSTNFTSTGIEINEDSNPSTRCVILQEILIIPELNPPYLRVKDDNEEIQIAYSNYDLGLADLMIRRRSSSDRFFKIYHSIELPKLVDGSTSGCTTIIFENYKISLVKTEKFPFESKINSLISYYQSNYEYLIEELNIPPGVDFAFEFIKSDGTKISVGEVPTTTDVYATETPIQYIDEYATILSGFINIKVW